MRRRLMGDVGKLKRLPTKKSRVTEPVQTHSYFHWKLLIGGLVLVLLDSIVNFRLEYLYPVMMFMRSVYDSYKYQGFIFSLLFISLVVYLDLLCWTVLTVPWLFIGASTCVWLEITRSLDHGFTYSALLLAVLFLYMEISQRISSLPVNMVNISRPFAAHCIGYPVVTMSFLIKHQITHIIRQRQQKKVSEENSVFFDILQKALPRPSPEDGDEGGMEDGGAGDGGGTTGGGVTMGNGIDNSSGKRVSPKSFVSSNGGNNSHKSHMSSTSASSNSSTSSSSSSTTGLSNNRNRINGLKSLVQQDSKLIKSPSTDAAGTNGSTPVAAAANGDVGSEGGKQLSGGNHKVHLTSTKRQSVVKTAPKVDQSATTTISELEHKIHKTRLAKELMYMDLKDERQARLELQTTVSQLELEIKKLKADLHASCLQEEETSSRVDQLVSLEKVHKHELQRLKNENENLQNKLNKCTSTRQQEQAAVTELEKKLKSETEQRIRAEAELRNYQHVSRNTYSAEEVKQLNEKFRKVEKDLDCTRKELAKKDKTCEDLKKELTGQCMTFRNIEGEKQGLKIALADETRVKIELFTALSDARRKHQSLADENHRKTLEISQLKQRLAEVMAIIPPHPSTPQPPPTSVGSGPVPYPPASSPQH